MDQQRKDDHRKQDQCDLASSWIHPTTNVGFLLGQHPFPTGMVGNIPFLPVIIARYALKKISLPVANTRYSEMSGFVDLNPSPIFFDKRYSFTKGPHKIVDEGNDLFTGLVHKAPFFRYLTAAFPL